MQRVILIGVGGLSLCTAAYIWGATQHWYDSVPGVVETGPLNMHFARDVALAYLASGVGLIWAGMKLEKSAGMIGALWLVLHAVFHISIWINRGMPADLVAITNLMGIQIPAFAAALAALTLKTERITA